MNAQETGALASPESLYRYRFGEVEFDEARFELRVGGLTVDSERKPLVVLLELLRRPGEVVSRADLWLAASDGRPAVNHALSNSIAKLRKSLGSMDEKRIATVAKAGYRFIGDLERIVVGRRSLSKLNLTPGQPIAGRSDYRLERLIGATDGNEVWLARRVNSPQDASVFKFGRHGESIARLKRETTIHRFLMDSLGTRPDLVLLKSWNFETAPFFVETDFCGQNLSEWAAAAMQLKVLGLEQRLGIFLQIADAVAAAHSVGVLHKDLKPTNVFIVPDTDGVQIKVGDFGNSSMLEPDRLAQFGITRMGMTVSEQGSGNGLSGTPLYLAPELMLGGRATVQTDVYALGILLWQLVFEGDCRQPMASGWEHGSDDPLLVEDIQLATAGDPRRRLATILDLTVRLRTREDRRNQQANAQAAKHRDFLAARSLEKARARRPWIIASIVALAIGFGASVYLYHAERGARKLAELDEKRVESTNAFLTDMLQRGDPSAPGGTRFTTIESAMTHAQDSLADAFRDDPAAKGSIDVTLGDAFFGQSQYGKALVFHQEAVSLLTSTLGTSHPATLAAAYKLAGNLDMVSRHEEAKAILDQTDKNAGPLLREPSRLSYLAHSTRGGSFLLQMLAAPALEQFLETDRIRAEIDPQNVEWLVHVRSDIAWCEVRLERNVEALQTLSVLITPAISPEHVGMSEWMKLHLQYGIALSNLGRYADAEQILRDAEEEAARRLGATSYVVGLAFNYLATSYRNAGDWISAARAAEKETQVFAGLGPQHQSAVGSRLDEAVIGYLKDPDDNSFAELSRAQQSVSQLLGLRAPITQYANFYLATADLDRGLTDQVAALIETLDPSHLASADISPDWPARVAALRGRFLLASNQKDEGVRLIRTAVDSLSAHGDPAWMIKPLEQILKNAGAI